MSAPSFLARSKKALAGGIAGAATALTTQLPPAIADGVFEIPGELLPVLTFTLGGFVIGYALVWVAPANAVTVEPEDEPIGEVDPADAGADDTPVD